MKNIIKCLNRLTDNTRTDLILIAFNGFSLGLTTHYVLDSHRTPMGFYLLVVLAFLLFILIALTVMTIETRVEQKYRKRLERHIG